MSRKGYRHTHSHKSRCRRRGRGSVANSGQGQREQEQQELGQQGQGQQGQGQQGQGQQEQGQRGKGQRGKEQRGRGQQEQVLDLAQCTAKYGTRGFMPSPPLSRTPPLLYTYPGGGNTWSRLLLDYATGVYSGSVYGDVSLEAALPGETSCNRSVSVVKSHPVFKTDHHSMLFLGEPPMPPRHPCTKGGEGR
ncbi:hypothetical protein B484DRAFT_262599 [Ochromonadaceae sp. CCMP2298]|nr:hypothetical protein B484DRAFT_262599 [Ochromonadaceae sp. CCMP2298]